VDIDLPKIEIDILKEIYPGKGISEALHLLIVEKFSLHIFQESNV
jgi:hypothetical protein